MNIDQFFDRLPRGQWHLDGIGMLSRPGCTCPIYAACGELGFIDPVTKAVQKLGMQADDAIKIIDAADKRAGFDPEIRARLLQHCGLTDPT